MKRLLVLAIALILSFFNLSSQAAETADNAKLRFISVETSSVARGSTFIMQLGVDSFESYLISADAIWLPEQANSNGERSGIYCMGYMPKNGDSARVHAIQKGVIKIECKVDRKLSEGTYRLWNLDLATVSCEVKFVMDAADVNGPKCPWANTLYSYRTGSPDSLGTAWATADQISPLGYEVEPFTSAPSLIVYGKAPVSIPELQIDAITYNSIKGNYIKNFETQCSISSKIGTLSENTEIDWTPRLPLNLAAQPNFNEISRFSITNLNPKSRVELILSCSAIDGESASRTLTVMTKPR